jgi:hypothetical protein
VVISTSASAVEVTITVSTITVKYNYNIVRYGTVVIADWSAGQKWEERGEEEGTTWSSRHKVPLNLPTKRCTMSGGAVRIVAKVCLLTLAPAFYRLLLGSSCAPSPPLLCGQCLLTFLPARD